MRSSRSALFALTAAVVGMAAGCASKPCQKPRVLSSYSPAGAPSAPPLNARAPIRVPTAPVGTPVAAVPAFPVTTVVPAAPGVAVSPAPAPAMAIPAQPAPQVQQVPAGQYAPPQTNQGQYTPPPTGQSYQQTPQLQPLPPQQQQQPQPNGNSSDDNRQGNGADAYDDVEPQRPLVAPSPPST